MIDYSFLEPTDELVKMVSDIETGKRELKKIDPEKVHITTWEESSKQLLDKIIKANTNLH